MKKNKRHFEDTQWRTIKSNIDLDIYNGTIKKENLTSDECADKDNNKTLITNFT